MGREWGDMYKHANALAFTTFEKAVDQPSKPAPLPSPSYDIREDLFERDDDEFPQEMGEETVPPGSVYPSYTPSRQTTSFFSLNLPTTEEGGDDEIYFPFYDDVECSDEAELTESPATTAPASQRSVSPDPIKRPEDDSAIRVQPSRQVDYLSNDWSEEDIRASWKHIVSQRGAYENSARLENASWRSWAKKRSNLRTVPPETVEWMKDHDLTWLYGPLTPGPSAFGESRLPKKSRRMSRSEISLHRKKPILKKRKLSEIMLQRSISSPLKQGVEPKLGTDSILRAFSSEPPAPTRSNTGMLSSKSTSGLTTPDGWKKVQFHGLVEQCIALPNAGDEDFEEYHNYSDSDDDIIIMRKSKKRATSRWLSAMQPKKDVPISKTIERLPHALLKSTEQLEDVSEEEINDQFSTTDSASTFSQDHTSDLIFLDNDSGIEDDMDWQPQAWLLGRKDSLQMVEERLSDIKMQEDVKVDSIYPHRPHLERTDTIKQEQKHQHVPWAPTRAVSDGSINFKLPPYRSQLALFPDSAPKDQRSLDYHFMMEDPGMTEAESESGLELSRSSSQSSESSEERITIWSCSGQSSTSVGY